ncbi:HAD-like domain-containing protein [Diaporthe sp. PMI_573]|nr:HAD-like domain-containing protein [Diaporthaceae sp. PMI_573]
MAVYCVFCRARCCCVHPIHPHSLPTSLVARHCLRHTIQPIVKLQHSAQILSPQPCTRSILTMTDRSEMRPEECPPALHLSQISLSNKSRVFPELQSVTRDFAFAFDIDGVLLRGKVPLDGAKQTLEMLQANSIPFILLTNGGGLSELAHAARLGLRLTMSLDEEQFVQSHTPFKTFVDEYKDDWIVVLGGHGSAVKELAAVYGFNPEKIITSSDIAKHHPSIHPFPEISSSYHDKYGNIADDFSHEEKIAAVFVFTSPRDWCLDLQICIDLLLSANGRLGTRSTLNGNANVTNHGYQQDGQPLIFWCNPDLQWATPHATPRLAQGAFRAALEGIWSSLTKGKAELQSWTCGKPTSTTYEYAEQILHKYHQKIEPLSTCPISKVYMIGDNPESDIRGANLADETSSLAWRSVLVETGVHKAGNTPEYQPTETKTNVWEAVRWAVGHETKVDIGELPEA